MNVSQAISTPFLLGIFLVLSGCTDSDDRVATGLAHAESEVRPSVEKRSPRASLWFDDLRDETALVGVKSADSILRRLADVFSGKTEELAGLPESVESDRAPRILIVSARAGGGPVQVGLGRGHGLRLALQDALSSVIRERPENRPDRRLWLKLDVVRKVGAPFRLTLNQKVPFERSLEGMAFSAASGLAFLPEELVAHTLVTRNFAVRVPNIERYVERTGRGRMPETGEDGSLTIRRFKTESYFFDGQQTFELFRGHRKRPEITRETLLKAARSAGDYLRRAVGKDGRFVYSYLPKSDRENKGYNMVRHAGTIFSMIDLFETTANQALLEAAERAIGYLVQHIEPFGDGESSVVAYRGKIKLGGVALAALALTEHVRVTGHLDHLPLARRLCRYILESQLSGGEFIHQRFADSGEIRAFNSMYYPGEALLALLRLHRVDPDEKLLDAAEKGARYLIEVRDRDVSTDRLLPDHWLLYALNELYRERPDGLYLEHALRITRAIRSKQNLQTRYPDTRGSYEDPPRSTPTATRSEGLLCAYKLLRDFGRPDEARSILESVDLSIGFQFITQMLPERTLYLHDADRVRGGITKTLTNYEIRIDYVQHNLSAFLCYYRILGAERGDR